MIEKYYRSFEEKNFLDVQKNLKEIDIEINVKKDEVFDLLKPEGIFGMCRSRRQPRHRAAGSLAKCGGRPGHGEMRW